MEKSSQVLLTREDVHNLQISYEDAELIFNPWILFINNKPNVKIALIVNSDIFFINSG